MVIYIKLCRAVAIFLTVRRERSDRSGFIIRNDDAEYYGEEDKPFKTDSMSKDFREKRKTIIRF
jgi:hypothetical protein